MLRAASQSPRRVPPASRRVLRPAGADAAGHAVRVQPASKVVHYEGITSGTDVTQGPKAYQVANQAKFLAKWRDALAAQPAPHGDGRHFDPAVDAELGEEAGHVGLDCARANAESRGDLPVVVSRHQQAEDVQLARAEPR